MKKIILSLILLILLLPFIIILAIYFSWSPYIEPKIRNQIIQLATKSGYGLHFDPIELNSWTPPFRIQLNNLVASDKERNLQIKFNSASIDILPTRFATNLKDLSLSVSISLQEPQIFIRIPFLEQSEEIDLKKQQIKPGLDIPMDLPSIDLDFSIIGGQIVGQHFTSETDSNSVWLSQISNHIKSKNIFSSAALEFDFESQLQYEIPTAFMKIKGQSPLKIKSKTMSFENPIVKIGQVSIDLGGLALRLSGSTDLNKMNHSWTSIVQIEDIKKLSSSGLLPEGNWSGSIQSQIEFQQIGQQKPKIAGNLRLLNIAGEILKPIRQDDAQIAGSFSFDSDVIFKFDEKPEIEKLFIDADLSKIYLFKKDLFYKRVNVPLFVKAKGKSNDKHFVIEKMIAQLDKMKMSMAGAVAIQPGQNSTINFSLHKTNLAGLEKMILPLKDYPVKGSLAFQSKIKGDLQNPLKLNININPVSLSISSGVKYSNSLQKISISGPFQAALQGNLQIAGKDIQSANVNLSANLNSMSIGYSDLFKKKAGEALSLTAMGSKLGNDFKVKKMMLTSFLGNVSTIGSVSNPLKPKISLNTKLSKINLSKIKAMVPELKQLPIDGYVSGQIKSWGSFDPKLGIQKSALTVSGDIQHSAQKIIMRSPAQTAKSGEQHIKIQQPEPTSLIPDWPIVRNSSIRIKSQISQFLFDDLKVDGILANLNYHKTQVTGKIQIAKIFSGKVELKKFKTNLSKVPTFFNALTQVKGLNIKSAVTWAMPEYKKMLKGRLFGQFLLNAPIPGHADLIKASKSSGVLDIKGFEVSTLKVDQMANDIIGKIPGMKDKGKVQTRPIEARFKTKYSYEKELLKFTNADLLTPDSNQLIANGSFHMNKTLNMKGSLFIGNLALDQNMKSCLADKHGRLEVPVAYKGSILEPKMSYGTQVISALGQKYLKCESKKQIDKAKIKVKKKAKAKIKKVKKKLEEDVKKKLKSIF